MTVPNLLTLLRILAVPFFAIALWYGHLGEACLIFAAAGITDLLDGFIARHFNQRSELGAILDPAADKLLMTTAFVLMTWRTEHLAVPIPVWAAILAISRDVLISLYGLLALAKNPGSRLRPTWLGKVTTAAWLAGISFGLLANALGPRPWHPFVFPWLYDLAALLTLASGIHYYLRLPSEPAAKV